MEIMAYLLGFLMVILFISMFFALVPILLIAGIEAWQDFTEELAKMRKSK